MPISSIYQIYKEMHTTHMTGSLNYPMKSTQKASHLQRISSGIKLLVFGARFHGARQTNFRMDKNLHRTVFRLHGTHAEPCKFLNDKQSICNWQAKGNLGGRPRTREKGGSFPPSLPPSLLRVPRVLSLPKSPSLPLRTPAMQGNLQQNLHGSV